MESLSLWHNGLLFLLAAAAMAKLQLRSGALFRKARGRHDLVNRALRLPLSRVAAKWLAGVSPGSELPAFAPVTALPPPKTPSKT